MRGVMYLGAVGCLYAYVAVPETPLEYRVVEIMKESLSEHGRWCGECGTVSGTSSDWGSDDGEFDE